MNEQEIEQLLFEGLSAEMEDPTLQKTIEAAKSWDEELRSSSGDNRTLHATIAGSLEKRWAQWKNGQVTVTGYAHRVLGNGSDIRPDPVLMTPDDVVISKGFSIVHTDVDGENIHGNPFGSQYRVVHDLRRQLDNGKYEQLYAFLDNHDVQSDIMSVEYAERWLNQTQPDFFNLLQEATRSSERAESKLVRIGTSCNPNQLLDVFNKKNRAAVESYVNNIACVDERVPYMFITRDKGRVFEDVSGGKGESYKIRSGSLRAVGRLSKVYFQKMEPSKQNNNAGDWWLSVKARVYGENSADEDRVIVLPLSSLKNARSLREFGYETLRRLKDL